MISAGINHIALVPPIYWPNGTNAQNALLQQYAATLPTVAAQYPGVVRVIGANAYAVMLGQSPSSNYFSDALHLTDAGDGVHAGVLLQDMITFLGLVPVGGGRIIGG